MPQNYGIFPRPPRSFATMSRVMNMNRIKKLRLEKGYTQAQMQTLAGIHQSQYSRLETGKSKLRAKQCIKISNVLETSTDYLLGLTDEKKPYKRRDKT